MSDIDQSAEWFDLCVPAELGVPHPPHAYSTPEPSGCPGYATHPDQWNGEGVMAMIAANPEPLAWYEQRPPTAS